MFDMTLALTGHKYEKCSLTKSVNNMFLNKISCLVGKWKCFFNNYRFPFPRTDFHFASYTLHFATFRLLVHSENCRFSSQISLFAKKSVTDVLTTFWHLLWSIIEQMLGNMESVCLVQWKMKYCLWWCQVSGCPPRDLYKEEPFRTCVSFSLSCN